MPIQNPFNTTVMPVGFRRGLIGIIVANICTTVGWDYFVVNGTRQYYAAKRRQERNTVTTEMGSKQLGSVGKKHSSSDEEEKEQSV